MSWSELNFGGRASLLGDIAVEFGIDMSCLYLSDDGRPQFAPKSDMDHQVANEIMKRLVALCGDPKLRFAGLERSNDGTFRWRPLGQTKT